MQNKEKSDFIQLHEKLKQSLHELYERKRLDKINICFSSFPENFDDYWKCFYSFDRALKEKFKYIEYTHNFFEMHYEKCKKSTNIDEKYKCFEKTQNISREIYEKLENEVNAIK